MLSRRTFLKWLLMASWWVLAGKEIVLAKSFTHWAQSLVNKTKHIIYLTIDDGPSIYMNHMANVLESAWSRATFFLVWNKIKGYEKLIIDILQRWHWIGNHSYDHANFALKNLEMDKIELKKTDDLLENIFVKAWIRPEIKHFRFPYGIGVKRQYSSDFWDYLESLWYNRKPVGWDVDTNDWRKTTTIGKLIRIVIGAKDWKIVLVHEKQKTEAAFSEIIADYKKYNIVSETLCNLHKKAKH